MERSFMSYKTEFCGSIFDLPEPLLSSDSYNKKNNEYLLEINNSGEIIECLGNSLKKNYCSIYEMEEIFPSHIFSKINKSISAVIKQKKIISFEFLTNRADNEKNYLVLFYPTQRNNILLQVKDMTEQITRDKFFSFYDKVINVIWNVSKDGICIINKSGEVKSINNAGCEILDISSEDINGITITDVFPKNSLEKTCEYLQKGTLDNFNNKQSPKKLLLRGNSNKIIEASYSNLNGSSNSNLFADEDFLISVFNSNSLCNRSKGRQKLFSDILQKISHTSDFKSLMFEIVSLIKEFSKLDAVTVRFQEIDDFTYIANSGLKAEINQCQNCLSAGKKKIETLSIESKLPLYGGMCNLVFNKILDPMLPVVDKHGSFWTNDSEKLVKEYKNDIESFPSASNKCPNKSFKSIAIIPITDGIQYTGLLQLFSRERDIFTQELISFYESLSESISLAIKMKCKEDELAKQTDIIEERGKFLKGIYQFRKILSEENITEEEIYKQLLVIISKVAYKTDVTNIRIEVNDRVYSENYCTTYLNKFHRGISLDNKVIGDIEIYINSMPPIHKEKLYIEELKNFLDIVCSELESYHKQKQTEIAKRHRDICFNSVWGNSNDGMRLTDSSGIIVEVNKAYCQLVEKEAHELIGQPIRSIYKDEEEYKKCEMKLESENVADMLEVKNRYETKVTFSTDKTCYLDITYSVINPNLILGIFRDDTAKVVAKKELVNKEKLATIGKFTSFLTHEIKSYLNPIKMSMELLEGRIKLPAIETRHFQLLKMQVYYLEKMIKRVLSYTKNSELRVSDIKLNDLILNLKSFLAPKLDKNDIEIQSDIDETIILAGDFEKIQSSLLHLFENSIDSIENTGQINVNTKINLGEKSFSLIVRDSGKGISNPEKAFQPFVSTKKYGTGLGLSVVRNYMKMHDAEIKLVSAEKGNTKFELIFPLRRVRYGNHLSN